MNHHSTDEEDIISITFKVSFSKWPPWISATSTLSSLLVATQKVEFSYSFTALYSDGGCGSVGASLY